MRARLALLITLAVALAACEAPRAEAPSPRAAPAIATLPATPLVTLDRQARSIRGATEGRVALVSLWATWCESCEREIDALNRLDDGARRRDAVVLGVAVGEPARDVAEYVRARGLRYAQLVDEDFRLADAIGQRRVPATFVLDREGRVLFAGGALDEAALAAFRDALAAPAAR